jgi:hypothetical protein
VSEKLSLTQGQEHESAGRGWQNIFATSTSNYNEEHVTSRLLAALAHDSVPVSSSLALAKMLTDSSEDLSDVTSITVDREFSPGEYPYHGESRHVVGISRYGGDILGAEPADRDARADGLIQLTTEKNDPVLTIILEAKRGENSLSAEQLNRYVSRFEADEGFCTRSWGEVCNALHSEAMELENSTAGVLLRELSTFLWEQEVAKRFGAGEYDDDGVVPEHRFWWDIRGGDTGLEVRLVDEYRSSNPGDIDLDAVDSVSELYDQYTSTWYDESEFDALFEAIPEEILQKAILDTPSGEKSRLEILTNWAQRARKTGEVNRKDFAGNPKRGIGEFKQGGQVAQLHLGSDGSPVLKFHSYKGKGQWGSPLTLKEHEFKTVIEAIPIDVRKYIFVERDFSKLDEFFEFRE